MLLLVTTLSLAFTSCGGDDEKDEPASKNPITSESYSEDCEITIAPGCQILRKSKVLQIKGGKICYAGNYSELNQITTAPDPENRYAWSTTTTGFNDVYIIDFKEGGYIIYTYGNQYVRMIIKYDYNQQSYNYQFQVYRPSNK